jgi:hypothetical protein
LVFRICSNLLCFGLFGSLLAPAQQPPLSAPLTLTVTDPTGAAIPSATIDLLPAGTTPATHLHTDPQGAATLRVAAGTQYTLRIHADGFRDTTSTLTGAPATLTIQLQVLPTSEQVSVQADADAAAAIDPQQTQSSLTLDRVQVANVPLNGRSLTDLLAIAPGVVPISSAQPNAVVMSGVASTPPSGDLDIGALSVSGQRETANAFFVNRSDVQEDVNMGIAIVPTLDSVAELQVLTDSFDAKFGNQSGGQILITTRSGGDHLHGTAYDYLRNTALDARSYFSSVRAPFRQNQFGGTLGGPTPLHALHFFTDFQGTRQTQGIDTGAIAVPSLADRTGNLADMASSLTGAVSGSGWTQILSQRLGYTVTQGEPYYQPGCASTQTCVFPNAQIPSSAFSAPAQHLLEYIPAPNLSASTFATSSYAQSLRDDKGALRLDLATRAGDLALYGFVDDYSLLNPYPTGQGGATVPGFNARNNGRAQLYSADLTSMLGAALANQAHLSYMRNAALVGQPVGGQGVSLASQGFVTGAGTFGIVPQAPSIEGIENLVFNDFVLGTTVTGLSQAENTLAAADDLTWTLAKHLFAFGASTHVDQINTHPNVYDNGSFSFTGTETGLDFADFLLGIDSTYTQGDGQNFYNRNHYIGLYAQDSWRLTPHLTLNYGARYDILPPWYEKYNQLLSLDPDQQSVIFPNAPRGILFPGDPAGSGTVPRTISPTRYNDTASRIAASWSPTLFGLQDNTVLRADYGVYYTAFEGLSAGIISGNPPYGFTDTTAAPTLFDQPFVEAATNTRLGQPFPLQHVPFGASPQHPITNIDWANFEPLTGIPAFATNNVTPYTENYTFSIERQLSAHTSAKLAYVGTQAHHLLVIQEVNPANPALCLALSQPQDVAPGSATCGPFNESSTFTSAAGVMYQGTRAPFSSAFGSVNLQRTIANSHDNAFEAELQHATHNLFVQLSYTWSKSIDQSSSLAEPVYPDTPFSNASRSRALSAFDITHNSSATYRYELPLLRLAPRPPRLASGWQISGLTRFATGLPVTLVNNNDTSLLGTAPNGINSNGIDEPEFTPGDLQLHHSPDPRSAAPAFNTSLFSLPALGTLGNARRRLFYGPGLDNTDLALSKLTPLHDNLSLDLRVEAFNVFNRSQFFGPAAVDGNISSANFGQIQTASPPRLLQLSARLHF